MFHGNGEIRAVIFKFYYMPNGYSNFDNTQQIPPKFQPPRNSEVAVDLSPQTHLDITHFIEMQWLPADVRVEQLNFGIMCTGFFMEKPHVILPKILE